jgi:hypothetical protein
MTFRLFYQHRLPSEAELLTRTIGVVAMARLELLPRPALVAGLIVGWLVSMTMLLGGC